MGKRFAWRRFVRQAVVFEIAAERERYLAQHQRLTVLPIGHRLRTSGARETSPHRRLILSGKVAGGRHTSSLQA